MQQIYRRTTMLMCDFNKVALQKGAVGKGALKKNGLKNFFLSIFFQKVKLPFQQICFLRG